MVKMATAQGTAHQGNHTQQQERKTSYDDHPQHSVMIRQVTHTKSIPNSSALVIFFYPRRRPVIRLREDL